MELDGTSLYVIDGMAICPRFTVKHRPRSDCASEYFIRQIAVPDAEFSDGRPYLLGEQFRTADIFLTSVLTWAIRYGQLVPERLLAYRERMINRPAYQSAFAVVIRSTSRERHEGPLWHPLILWSNALVGVSFMVGSLLVSACSVSLRWPGTITHVQRLYRAYRARSRIDANRDGVSAYGLATLMAALCLPAMGWFLDRAGAKRMLAVVALLFVPHAPRSDWSADFFGLLSVSPPSGFLGQGSLMMGSSNMVSQWFTRKRGTALGLMTMGFGISMAVHPELSQWLIEWPLARRGSGLGYDMDSRLTAIVILAISKPEDVGLHPDGVNRSSTG